MTKSNPKVLLILREQSNDPAFGLQKEVAVMAAMLEKAGIAVISASASGRPIGTGAAVVAPDLKLEEVRNVITSGTCPVVARETGNPGGFDTEG